VATWVTHFIQPHLRLFVPQRQKVRIGSARSKLDRFFEQNEIASKMTGHSAAQRPASNEPAIKH
jgi:lipopolysaccharide export system protein LptC